MLANIFGLLGYDGLIVLVLGVLLLFGNKLAPWVAKRVFSWFREWRMLVKNKEIPKAYLSGREGKAHEHKK